MEEQKFQYLIEWKASFAKKFFVVLPDGVKRRVFDSAVFLNPDADAMVVVRYLQGSSFPGRQMLVRPEEAERIKAAENVSLIPTADDVAALVLDAPVDGTRVIVQPLSEDLSNMLMQMQAGFTRKVFLADANRVLDEWAKSPPTDDAENRRRVRGIGRPVS